MEALESANHSGWIWKETEFRWEKKKNKKQKQKDDHNNSSNRNKEYDNDDDDDKVDQIRNISNKPVPVVVQISFKSCKQFL